MPRCTGPAARPGRTCQAPRLACGGAWCDISEFSCSSATLCQDQGNYCNDSGCDNGTSYFTDFWNGVSWSSPDFGGPGFGGLQACACRAFCMELDPPKAAAITNNWGKTWQSAKVNLATACHHLARCVNRDTLACSSAHFCMAFLDQVPVGALVWNGAKWSATKMPHAARRLPNLTDLSCGSPTNCMATGTYQTTPVGTPKSVAEHWNGKAWTVTPSPGSETNEHGGITPVFDPPPNGARFGGPELRKEPQLVGVLRVVVDGTASTLKVDRE